MDLIPHTLCRWFEIKSGLGYREIREKIQSKHPRGDRLNAGNITRLWNRSADFNPRRTSSPL